MTEPQIPDDFPQYCGRTDSMGVECEKPELERQLAKAEEERDYFRGQYHGKLVRESNLLAENAALKARNEEIYADNLAVSKWKGERIRELEKQVARLTEQP